MQVCAARMAAPLVGGAAARPVAWSLLKPGSCAWLWTRGVCSRGTAKSRGMTPTTATSASCGTWAASARTTTRRALAPTRAACRRMGAGRLGHPRMRDTSDNHDLCWGSGRRHGEVATGALAEFVLHVICGPQSCFPFARARAAFAGGALKWYQPYAQKAVSVPIRATCSARARATSAPTLAGAVAASSPKRPARRVESARQRRPPDRATFDGMHRAGVGGAFGHSRHLESGALQDVCCSRPCSMSARGKLVVASASASLTLHAAWGPTLPSHFASDSARGEVGVWHRPPYSGASVEGWRRAVGRASQVTRTVTRLTDGDPCGCAVRAANPTVICLSWRFVRQSFGPLVSSCSCILRRVVGGSPFTWAMAHCFSHSMG